MMAREWYCHNPACDEHGEQATPGRLRKWCSDRCRKVTLYGGECRVCGAVTNGYDGRGTASDLCCHCAPVVNATWTREAIISRLQAWWRINGTSPAATDFMCRISPDGDPVPLLVTVQNMFGSWTAALDAAGLPQNRRGPVAGYTTLTAEQRLECALRYADGEPSTTIARDLGCRPGTVLKWVRHHGGEVRAPLAYVRATA